MKNIVLTGRLVFDPELREVGEKKTKVAKLRLANNDVDKEKGEFYDVQCWEKLAEYASNYLKKGARILVQGTFSNEGYQDKEGKNRTHFQITANKLESLS